MIRIASEQVHRSDVVAVVAAREEPGRRAIVHLADGRALRTGQAPATLKKKLRDPVFPGRDEPPGAGGFLHRLPNAH